MNLLNPHFFSVAEKQSKVQGIQTIIAIDLTIFQKAEFGQNTFLQSAQCLSLQHYIANCKNENQPIQWSMREHLKMVHLAWK